MKRPLLAFCALASAALISACGGGGGGSSITGGTPPTPNTSTATVQFSITEPSSSSKTSAVRPQFAAPAGTQSVSIVLRSVNGNSVVPGAPTIVNMSANTPGCSVANAQLTCSVSVQAPAGSDVFAVTMYQQPNGQGTPLGAGNVTVAAPAGQTVTAPATLNGTVASVTLAIPSQPVPEGEAATLPVTLIAKDANGNTIVGTYTVPISLADTDASAQTALSATTVADSSAAANVTLTYKGGAMPQAATLAATVQNASAQARFQPNRDYPAVDNTTLVYGTSEIGEGGGGIFGTTPPFIMQNPSVGTQTVTASTGKSFNGQNNLVDFHTVAVQSPNPTVTTDQYYAWSNTSSSASLLLVGSTMTKPSFYAHAPAADGTTDTISCQAPFAAMWIVPFPQSWDALTGTGPCVEHRTVLDSTGGSVSLATLDRTLNADGSFTVAEGSSLNGVPKNFDNTRIINADGTATQHAQWIVCSMTCSYPSSIVTIGTPAPGASTIPYQITNFPGAIPSPGATTTPAPVATTMPNWYTAAGIPNGVVPRPLASTTFTNKGVVAGLPPQCAVPLSVVSATATITEIDETHSALDPTQGYELDLYQYFVVSGMGPVCVQESTFTTSPGFIYMSIFSMGGGYFKTTAYLTATTLQSAFRQTKSIGNAITFAQAGLLAAVQAHDASVRASFKRYKY